MKQTSNTNLATCEITDEDVEIYRTLSQHEQRVKFGNCDLTSFQKINAAFTPETVELINKQVAFELGLLGYNKQLLEDPILTQNIKEFQKSLGEPESGRLTHKQLIEANKLASKKSYFAVRLPLNGNGFGPNVNKGEDTLEFQGTWKIEGESLDGPYEFSDSKFNFWEFECDKKTKKCESIHLDLGVTDEVVGMGMGRFKKKSYDVLSWDTDKVVFRDDTFMEQSCREAIIRVYLEKGEVEQTVTQKNKCNGYSDLVVPKVSNLVSSWERAKELNAHRLEQTLSVYTEDYMKLKSAR